MRQVLLREGRIVVESVPHPTAEPGKVLVRTTHSVVSAGTERAVLRASEPRSLVQEATDPSRIRRAFDVLRDEGPAGVLERLRDRRVSSALALGYSAAGLVDAVGTGVSDLPPGTRVACGGSGHACHAEWIAVPRNLVTPVPVGVPLKEAAFTTLGAIALQGVRRSGIRVGECAVVLGLGLIGTLTAQILGAAGAQVIGFDLDRARAERCRRLGFEAHDLASRDPRDEVPRLTGGLLADAVLVCAASKGSEVANLGMALCRKKGALVIVGDVGLSLDRSLLYEKELDLLISTSYGPGRYDRDYEEKGIDYPLAYVRWTENRNMGAFLTLLRGRRVAVAPLIDRVVPLEEAAAAYAEIDRAGDEAPPLGVVLSYPASEDEGLIPGPEGSERGTTRVASPVGGWDLLPVTGDKIGVGLCGAGGFVKGVHLPVLRKIDGFALRGVATATPLSARETADRFGIPRAAADLEELLGDDSVNLVLIGTRHHLHAALAHAALEAGKHLLVEKPLCLDEAEVTPLLEKARLARLLLAVGFNRRYSPLVGRAREVLSQLSGPSLAHYRVNAAGVPPSHWVHDPVEGGGRILGECCHFVDLLLHLLEGPLIGVEAGALPSDGAGVVRSDSFAALLSFEGGSRAVLTYTGLGDPGLEKERIEIFKGGVALVLDDFRLLRVHGRPGGSLALKQQDKGYVAQWEAIRRALRGEPSDVITPSEVEAAMRGTFMLDRAVRGER